MPTSYAEPETARTPALLLDQVRERYRQAGPSGVAGWACTFLVEGDWYATPGSSPEALGFDLANWGSPSPRASQRDLARAASAYDRAAELLAGVDEPRALGALAEARRACVAPATTRGTVSAARRRPTRSAPRATPQRCDWHVLRPSSQTWRWGGSQRRGATPARVSTWSRGAWIADLLRWGLDDGSVGWTTGLGRLFQRAAECWAAEGDYERAAVAYELAIPLVPASGAEPGTGGARPGRARPGQRLDVRARSRAAARPWQPSGTSRTHSSSRSSGLGASSASVTSSSARSGRRRPPVE